MSVQFQKAIVIDRYFRLPDDVDKDIESMWENMDYPGDKYLIWFKEYEEDHPSLAAFIKEQNFPEGFQILIRWDW